MIQASTRPGLFLQVSSWLKFLERSNLFNNFLIVVYIRNLDVCSILASLLASLGNPDDDDCFIT